MNQTARHRVPDYRRRTTLSQRRSSGRQASGTLSRVFCGLCVGSVAAILLRHEQKIVEFSREKDQKRISTNVASNFHLRRIGLHLAKPWSH